MRVFENSIRQCLVELEEPMVFARVTRVISQGTEGYFYAFAACKDTGSALFLNRTKRQHILHFGPVKIVEEWEKPLRKNDIVFGRSAPSIREEFKGKTFTWWFHTGASQLLNLRNFLRHTPRKDKNKQKVLQCTLRPLAQRRSLCLCTRASLRRSRPCGKTIDGCTPY